MGCRRAAPAASLALLALLALPAAGALHAAGEPEPLTNVDVVRMAMSGLSEENILERIRSGPTAFDVDPEILRELEAAGVPSAVIDEMVALTRAPSGEGREQPAPEETKGILEVVFDTDPARDVASRSIVAPAAARPLAYVKDEGIVETRGEPAPVALAFLVTCSVPTHVPDHWTDATPVGRIVGRHRLVFFQEATASVPGQERFVYLDHPPSWSIPMAAGIHKGHLGGAVRTGEDGEFFELFLAPYEDLEIAPGATTRVRVRLESPGPKRRSRRGFLLKSHNSSSESALLLGDPRLRSRVEILEIGSPGAEGPAEEREPEEAGSAG